MKRLATVLAAALAFAVAGTSSPQALAAPLHVPVPVAPAPAASDVIKTQGMGGDFRRGGRDYRGGRHYRGGHHRGGRYYRGGRHHYRPHARHRYRGGDFVAPLVGGLIIGGMIANQAPRHYRHSGHGSAHVNWCYNRYRSYDARTDTFQPYHGPRRKCHSPYG